MMHPASVLIVDDDPAIIEVLDIVLSGAGYRVMTDTGSNVDDVLEGDVPNVILLDIWMRGEDGRDICRRIKSDSRTSHVPVILMSAHSSAISAVAESGADAFIEKPFDVDDLLRVVGEHLMT
jgi:CheY-like chemotaxis protein